MGRPSVAAAAAALGARWRSACEAYTAVVVQLDLCQFTSLTGAMAAIEVAEMVHALFSAFDAAVCRLGLFKMDTIGDAYVVAGFLPAGGDGDGDGVRRVCEDALEVGRPASESLAGSPAVFCGVPCRPLQA